MECHPLRSGHDDCLCGGLSGSSALAGGIASTPSLIACSLPWIGCWIAASKKGGRPIFPDPRQTYPPSMTRTLASERASQAWTARELGLRSLGAGSRAQGRTERLSACSTCTRSGAGGRKRRSQEGPADQGQSSMRNRSNAMRASVTGRNPHADVCNGSKPERLLVSKTGPLFTRKQTWGCRSGTSASGQNQTHAPQQTAYLFDHLVGDGE